MIVIMKKRKLFYFACSHSFEYPYVVSWTFKRKNDQILHRWNHSAWIEAKNYIYYGEPVTCIIPAENMDYTFVFNLLITENEDSDNIFGAINYLFYNYREQFLKDVKSHIFSDAAEAIILQFFKYLRCIGQLYPNRRQ